MKKGPPSEVWTRHCPVCDYDLRGLPEDRCPECGNEFDPSQLPVVRADDYQPVPLTNILLVLAVVLSTIQFSLGPTYENTIFQVAWSSVVWMLAGLWVWLRRPDFRQNRSSYVLLWLLLVCAYAPARPYLPHSPQLGLQLFSLAVAICVITYVSLSRPGKVIRGASGFLFFGLAFMGVLFFLIGGTQAILGINDVSSSYHVLGWKWPAKGIYHVLFAGFGAIMGLIGFAGLRLIRSNKRRV